MKITLRHRCHILFALLAVVVAARAESAGTKTTQVDRAGSLNSELMGGWHLVRTPNPNGGADAVSIMHTVDPSKSDLDIAGLMIRCHDGGTQVVIVLLRDFPVRAKPRVVLGKPGNEIQFEATVTSPGTAILLPGDAKELVNNSWHAENDLLLQIDSGHIRIHGVIPLTGLRAAYNLLAATCSRQ